MWDKAMTNNVFFRNKVTTINGIMCALVAFLHSENVDRYSDSIGGIALLESFISKTLGDIAVPTFFFMSAILFFQNYDLSRIWSKYKSRISSVVIPYLLWNLLYFVLFFVLTNNPLSGSFMDTKAVTIDAKVLVDSILFHQYNRVYWFMYQLILFILISPIVYVVMKNPYGIAVVPGFIVLGYRFPNIPNVPNGIIINSLIYWLLGAYFVLHARDWIYNRSSKKKIYLTLSFSAALILVRFYLECVNQQFEVSGYVLNLLLLPNIIALWFALDIFKFNHIYGWMKMSFFIYSMHPLIVDTIKKAVSVLLPENNVIVLGNYIVSAVGGIMISAGIAKIMVRFTPQIYRVLCGGRSAA